MIDHLYIQEIGYFTRKTDTFVLLSVIASHNHHEVTQTFWYGSGELSVMPTLAWLCQEYDCDAADFQPSLVLTRLDETPLPMRLIPNPLTFNHD